MIMKEFQLALLQCGAVMLILRLKSREDERLVWATEFAFQVESVGAPHELFGKRYLPPHQITPKNCGAPLADLDGTILRFVDSHGSRSG